MYSHEQEHMVVDASKSIQLHFAVERDTVIILHVHVMKCQD